MKLLAVLQWDILSGFFSSSNPPLIEKAFQKFESWVDAICMQF